MEINLLNSRKERENEKQKERPGGLKQMKSKRQAGIM